MIVVCRQIAKSLDPFASKLVLKTDDKNRNASSVLPGKFQVRANPGLHYLL